VLPIESDEPMSFFRTPDHPVYAVELVAADGLFTRSVLQSLSRNLSDVTGAGRHGDPVALWLRHSERGDRCVSSTSELKSVLCHHQQWVEKVGLDRLDQQRQSAVRDILGTFFLEGNLCEKIYLELDLDKFTPVETAHFRTFSLFWQPETFEEFESDWEGLEHVDKTEFLERRVLKACACPPKSYEDAIAQRMGIRRGLRLIQGYGVIGTGDFAVDEHDRHWRGLKAQG
jgi:hypothetical protein